MNHFKLVKDVTCKAAIMVHVITALLGVFGMVMDMTMLLIYLVLAEQMCYTAAE